MRKHFFRVAALAAPVILIGGLAASSAGASTRTPPTTGATVSTVSQAGYQATGRDYRYAQATVTVPDAPSASGTTSPQTDTCTIATAPTFTVDVTGTHTSPLVLRDGGGFHFLVPGTDYTVSPSPALGAGTYTVTLADSGGYAAGDVLTALSSGNTVIVEGTGGKDTYTVPTETCALSHRLDASDPVTITDLTKTSKTLVGGTDYQDIANGSSTVTLTDSGAWAYGDKLSIAYTGYGAYNYSPSEYVQLGSSTDFARVGITDDHNDAWEAFVAVGTSGLFGQHVQYVPLPDVSAGDGVTVSVYYNTGGNELFFTVADQATALNWAGSARAHGAVYTEAAALDDWGFTSSGKPFPLPAWAQPFKISSFFGVAFTTARGDRGSVVGPWETSAVQATSNGLAAPSGTVRVSPSALASDGIAANGAVRASDSFTVNAVG